MQSFHFSVHQLIYISDIYLIHIFHPSHGLLLFIEKTLGKTDYKTTQNKALEILVTVVNNFQISNKYVLYIYSLSAKIIKSNTDATVKYRVFDLLMVCFEKIDRYLENNDAVLICKELLNSLRVALSQKHSDTGKSKN